MIEKKENECEPFLNSKGITVHLQNSFQTNMIWLNNLNFNIDVFFKPCMKYLQYITNDGSKDQSIRELGNSFRSTDSGFHGRCLTIGYVATIKTN